MLYKVKRRRESLANCFNTVGDHWNMMYSVSAAFHRCGEKGSAQWSWVPLDDNYHYRENTAERKPDSRVWEKEHRRNVYNTETGFPVSVWEAVCRIRIEENRK